jgi:hypothetical protein
MAVSGTVPAKNKPGFDANRIAKGVRRFTFVAALLGFTWFLLRFGTRWVPAGMDTLPDMPPGSWCLVDRWAKGLRVGSEVFVTTPAGPLLSRVTELSDAGLRIAHDHRRSAQPEGASFGLLPRSAVEGTVMVVLHEGELANGR